MVPKKTFSCKSLVLIFSFLFSCQFTWAHSSTFNYNDVIITSDATSITIDGLQVGLSEVQLFDEDYNSVHYCYLDCGSSVTVSDLSIGEHHLKVKVWSEEGELECDIDQDIMITGSGCPDEDGDGVCADDDCDDNDPDFPMTAGTACDDGDASTGNDEIQLDGCTCAGTTISTPIDCAAILISSTTTSITIEGLPEEQSEIQLFDEDYNSVYYCYLDCMSSTTVSDLSDGEHHLKIKVWNTEGDLECDIDEDIEITGSGCLDADGDGVCAEDDCDDNDPDFPMTAGTACDDGDATTENDEIQSDGCTCAGTTISTPIDCVAILISNTTTSITIEGLPEEHSEIQLFDEDYNSIYYCYLDCMSSTTVSDLSDGEYHLKVKVWNTEGDLECDIDEDIEIAGSGCPDADGDGVCAADDCDDNDANFPMAEGTACDDGNAGTENDEIQSDGCTCAGTPIQISNPCGDDVFIFTDVDVIVVGGLDLAPSSMVEVFNDGLDLIFNCQGNCDEPFTVIPVAEFGLYTVVVSLFDENGVEICRDEELVIIEDEEESSINTGQSPHEAHAVFGAEEMIVYPNPAINKDVVFVNLTGLQNNPGVLRIYNILGKLIFEETISDVERANIKIDFANHQGGMYIINFDQKERNTISQKLVLTRD